MGLWAEPRRVGVALLLPLLEGPCARVCRCRLVHEAADLPRAALHAAPGIFPTAAGSSAPASPRTWARLHGPARSLPRRVKSPRRGPAAGLPFQVDSPHCRAEIVRAIVGVGLRRLVRVPVEVALSISLARRQRMRTFRHPM